MEKIIEEIEDKLSLSGVTLENENRELGIVLLSGKDYNDKNVKIRIDAGGRVFLKSSNRWVDTKVLTK